MEEKSMIKRQLTIFTILTLAITWALFSIIPIRGLVYGDSMSIIITVIAMFVPSISNVITRLITKEGFGNMYLRPNFKGHIKEYLVVFFGPSVMILLSAVFYFLIFPNSFDPELTVFNSLASTSGGMSANTLLLISILQVILIGPIVNIIPTLGEELGWRGYLLPKLRKLYSDRYALIITGVIWGIWHAPIIAMGHNYGVEYIGYPWLGILAMTIFCISLGIIEGYISIKLDSVIPAAMIHSTVNAGAALPIYLTKAGYNPILGPAITGLVGGFLVMVLALILFVKIGKIDR